MPIDFLTDLSDSSLASLGFFWKSGDAGPKSVSLATAIGAISSSCSFAALAAARALIRKGAHFVAGVAFMFASTNLVIELGILIYIFLGSGRNGPRPTPKGSYP